MIRISKKEINKLQSENKLRKSYDEQEYRKKCLILKSSGFILNDNNFWVDKLKHVFTNEFIKSRLKIEHLKEFIENIEKEDELKKLYLKENDKI